MLWARKVFGSQMNWEHKVRSTSPSSWRLVLGIVETETDRGRSGVCRTPFEVEQTARRRDQIRSVKFQGVTSACSAIGAGSMAMRRVRMGS